VKRFALSALLFLVGVQMFVSTAVAQGLGGPQVPVAKATIEGTVVRSPSGEAVPRAQISIVRSAPAPVAAGQPNPAATQPQAGQRGAGPQGAQGQQNAAAQTPSIAPVFTDDQGKFDSPISNLVRIDCSRREMDTLDGVRTEIDESSGHDAEHHGRPDHEGCDV
jgi:hypothetical protein